VSDDLIHILENE